MTDNDVKKLKRVELLEMLIEATAENEKLKAQISQLEQTLSQRQLNLENSGSIAEASLLLTNVFAEAQKAADLYLENIRRQDEEISTKVETRIREMEEACSRQEQETKERCEKLSRETEESCSSLKSATEAECERQKQETENLCNEMKKQAKDICSYIEQETREKCIWLEQEARQKCEAMLKQAEERTAESASTLPAVKPVGEPPRRKSLLGRTFGKK